MQRLAEELPRWLFGAVFRPFHHFMIFKEHFLEPSTLTIKSILSPLAAAMVGGGKRRGGREGLSRFVGVAEFGADAISAAASSPSLLLRFQADYGREGGRQSSFLELLSHPTRSFVACQPYNKIIKWARYPVGPALFFLYCVRSAPVASSKYYYNPLPYH